ncbi:MAG: hypothetical protein CMM47_01750 [Rhodospirillaceae bacterium]|nr:hypothetical protein [Rhodospirillaceae bacterium]
MKPGNQLETMIRPRRFPHNKRKRNPPRIPWLAVLGRVLWKVTPLLCVAVIVYALVMALVEG